MYTLTFKNIENTIPHPAPEEICCCHQPIQLGTAGGKKNQTTKDGDRQTDRQTDKGWSVEKTEISSNSKVD